MSTTPVHPWSPRGVGALDDQSGTLFLGGGHLGCGVRLFRARGDASGIVHFRLQVDIDPPAQARATRCIDLRVAPTERPADVLRVLAAAALTLAAEVDRV